MRRQGIVIVQDTLRPGGTERHSVWLAGALRDEAGGATLLLFQPPANGRLPPQAQVEVLQGRRTPFCWFAPGLAGKLRELEAGLVLCMGRNANAYAGWIRRRVPEARVVSTVRTSRRLPALYRSGIRRSHRCLTNSRWGAEVVAVEGLKAPGEIVTIPNALLRPALFDLDRSPPAMSAARASLGLPQDAFILANIASFLPGKNKETLLRAFSQSRHRDRSILLLAGSGPGKKRSQKLAARLSVQDRIRFFDHSEDIAPMLQSADLFVSTALRDALPNAAIEAQAAGVPVVAFDVAGVGETFSDGRSGICVPAGDEAGFAETVDSLLESAEKRARYSAAARRYARERFHPDSVAGRYRDFIRELFRVPPDK